MSPCCVESGRPTAGVGVLARRGMHVAEATIACKELRGCVQGGRILVYNMHIGILCPVRVYCIYAWTDAERQ
eukprot:11302536-Alexandrium_andersonii.AAC.1